MTHIFARWLVAVVAAVALSGCASSFRADVTRFHVGLPKAQQSAQAAADSSTASAANATADALGRGQSFYITSDDSMLAQSLEFAHYADKAADRLVALGYRRADSEAGARLRVGMRYVVGKDRSDYSRECRSSFRTRFGYGYPYGGWGWGWAWSHPLWWDDDICRESYTLYHSTLALYIHDTATDKRLFEGRAQSNSRRYEPTQVVPQLITALFTDFPGASEETIEVSLPPLPKEKKQSK